MFPARIVALICEYSGNDGLYDAGSAWRTTVSFLKRDVGETKFGSVPFPEGLIQMLGENKVGDRAALNERSRLWEPPAGLRYRRVIRAEHNHLPDSLFAVPRGATLDFDGGNWRVRYNRLYIDGFESIEPRDDSSSDEEPFATYVEFIKDHDGVYQDLVGDSDYIEGDEYEPDSDYDHEQKPDGEPQFECLGCGEPCQVQLTCDCGGDFCENCKCDCEVDLFCLAQSNSLYD